jgi:predicted nuclease of predicted toxin-antitoxin system
MKFVVDAQLPPLLAHWLNKNSHDAVHVHGIGLEIANDSAIWNHALKEGRIVITKDEDFPNRLAMAKIAPVIIWVRVGNLRKPELLRIWVAAFPMIETKLQAGEKLVELS